MRLSSCLIGAAIVMGSFGVSLAADLGNYPYGQKVWPDLAPRPVTNFLSPAPVLGWTGFYAGFQGGFGGHEFDYPVSAPTLGVSGDVTLNSSGFFGGGQLGYNWQVTQLVFGVEADMSASGIEGKLGASGTALGVGALSASAGTKLDWFGTVRGRVGYLIRPDMMIYGTGGWAFGHTTSTATLTLSPGGTFSASASNDKSGWTAGAGIEYAITPYMSFKTEYLYVDLGTDPLFSTTVFGAPISVSEQTRIHTIKAGLNFKFGGLGGWL